MTAVILVGAGKSLDLHGTCAEFSSFSKSRQKMSANKTLITVIKDLV